MSEIPLIQSVLYPSPYSGCRCYPGWSVPKPRPVPGTTWPSPYNRPGATMCVDKGSKPVGSQNVQQVAFRPSAPYPRYVLGPGGDPVKPMPRAWTQKVGVPPYNLRAIAGPSTMGPMTYANVLGITNQGADYVVGSGGQASGHSLGLS